MALAPTRSTMNCGAAENFLLDWHVAARPMGGQAVSGDLYVVRPFAGGALLAVVDGLGHGEEATGAARAAVAILEAHAGEPIASLTTRCHQALKRTRGVVLTVAALSAHERTIAWLGVGNVEGRLLRPGGAAGPRSESVLLRSGLVGLQLPPLQASVLPVAPGDLIVLATDGIHPGFDARLNLAGTPRRIADRILEQHFRGTDDALVLVARYRGDRDE